MGGTNLQIKGSVFMGKRPLTPKQAMFVEELQVDMNATAAAIRAGYSVKTADKAGYRLLGKSVVQEEISRLMKKRADKVRMKAEDVLREWVDIATADPAELVRPRRGSCRYCWGDNISNPTKAPNPECTKCHGEGIMDVYAADINDLSPKARKLYAGAKVKSDGSVEIKLRDQDRALENIAKHLGMFLERQDIKLSVNSTDTIREAVHELTLEEAREKLKAITNGGGND